MYHYQDITRFKNCKRLFQLMRRTREERSGYFSYYNVIKSPESSILKKLGVVSYFKGSIGDSVQVSLDALKENEWIVQARFEYRGLRIRIPILHHTDSLTEVYFTSNAPYPGTECAETFSVSVEILRQCGIVPDKVFLVFPNMQYVREDELDDDRMWIVSENFITPKGNISKSVYEVIREKQKNLDEIIDRMEKCEMEELREPVKNSYCTKREQCRFYADCFPEFKDLPDNSIMHLASSSEKEKMFRNGILYLKDIDLEKMDASRVQYAQVMADRCGGFYADHAALKHWFEGISSDPAIFLDFEWDLYLIPPYPGMKPIHPVVNQYSIHIVNGDTIEHKEYLGEGDCRRELAEALLRDIPSYGKIYAFNAKGAERIRIEELAEYFPDLAEDLLDLNKRLVDLQVPFESGVLYDVRMKGTYSLKTLTKMIDPYHSYSDLDVSEGLEAVEIHRLYEKCEDLEEKERMAKDLKEYCSMDTEELVKLYFWMESLLDSGSEVKP